MTRTTTLLITACGLALSGCVAPTHVESQDERQPSDQDTAQHANHNTGHNEMAPAFDPYEMSAAGSLTSAPYFADESGIIATTGPSSADDDALAEENANVRRVTYSFEGADFDPATTPDGQRIVFSSTRHRPTADIFIKTFDSSVVTQLTDHPAQDVMPAVAPDGSHIAFASNRTGSWDIFVIPVTGGKALQLTSGGGHDLHPSWSPDGSSLVFSRLGQTSGRWELWVAEMHNPNVAHFIGYGLFPEWCPVPGTGMNGADQIVFQRSRKRGDRSFEIWSIDYQNGEAGNLTQLAASPFAALINPTWSPDGRRVAFATVPNPSDWSDRNAKPDAADIGILDVRGDGGRVTITSGRSVDLMPFWGSNGQILFVSDRGGNDNIWTMESQPAVMAATGPALIKPGRTFAQPDVTEQTTGNSVANVPTDQD